MPFLTPLALGLLALAPLIVLMYLLKLKRRPVTIPSTLLWRRSVQDMVANAPFQRLRNNLLLWLQLLILLLLVLALARPVMRLSGMGGESVIVLMDLSASMQTVDEGGQTRLDKAKKLAHEAVDKMSSGNAILGAFGARDEMMIIGVAERTYPLQTMTTDKGALRAAINAAEAHDTAADLSDAGYILKEKTMMMEGDALIPNDNARVILISDGGVGDSINSLADVVNVDFSLVGTVSDNVGFTSVDMRESFAGTFEYQVFASLFNSDPSAKSVFVEMELGGEVLDIKKVDLPAQGEGSVVFSVGEHVSGLAELRLVDHRDSFQIDDTIRVQVSPPTEIKVLLVSRGNPFIEQVFNVDPRVTVEVVRPQAYDRPREGYDLFIYDGFSPPEIGPGNHLFINAVPPAGNGYSFTGEEVKSPQVVDWNMAHPLTRFANFERVLISSARVMKVPRDATALVQAASTDLISLHENESRRILVISFDILKSYWPLDVSFPIFFGNLVDQWSRTGIGAARPSYTTGETVAIVPPRDAGRATVTTPAGDSINYSLEGQSTIYLTNTQKQGLYQVTFDEGAERTIPINLASRLESNITPVEELEFGGRTVAAVRESVKSRQEIWPWLLLLGLGVLMAEWAIYCRRTFM